LGFSQSLKKTVLNSSRMYLHISRGGHSQKGSIHLKTKGKKGLPKKHPEERYAKNHNTTLSQLKEKPMTVNR